MKKYKLIKEYPGSPKVGTIFEYWTDGISEQVYNKSITPSFISLKTVKKYSEFWEEVIEKDYEILSFKQNSGITDLWTNFGLEPNCWCRNVNNFPVTKGYTLEQILNNSLYYIHSVKRLSDGEIFTIGDKYEVMNPIKETRTIASFHLSDNTLVIHPEEFGYSLLNDISFLKKPLFTTEDGVDIFENKDGEIKYWTLYNENSQCKANIWKISDAPIIVKNLIPHRTEVLKRIGLLRFSTKEAAEEYRLMNKPCLSIEEVMSVAYNPVESRTSSSRKLKEIVKSKL